MTQSLNSIFPLDLCKRNMLLSNMIYKTGNTGSDMEVIPLYRTNWTKYEEDA